VEFFHKVYSFPFMATRRVWYTLSIVLVVASLVLFFTRGLNLAVDFTGGTVVEAAFPQAPSIDKVREALEAAGFKDPTVQNVGTGCIAVG
jgi:preprotein translocase subunit SecF